MVRGRLGPDDVEPLCERVRVVHEANPGRAVVCDVGGLTDPDIGTVGAFARLQLTARRLGTEVQLRDASADLRNLIALAGLGDVVPCSALVPSLLPVEPGREAEQRKELGGVEEEGDPADPIA